MSENQDPQDMRPELNPNVNDGIAWAAVDEDEYILAHPEGLLIDPSYNILKQELETLDVVFPHLKNSKIVKIKISKIEEKS